MKVLDLFCGAGGAAWGIKQASPKADITGVDINPQPDYPFEFMQEDVLSLEDSFLNEFDFIWASPPCQAYSKGGNKESRRKYPKLIEETRRMINLDLGTPFVIENVPGAPLRKDLILCGQMFGLKIIRHRIFEIEGFYCEQPDLRCKEHKGKVVSGEYVMVCTGGRPGCYGNNELRKKLKNPNVKQAQEAMGITHIQSFKAIAESVPPKYSEYIFNEFLKSFGEKREKRVAGK